MNPRDLAFMAKLGYTARRAGYRIETRWWKNLDMQYRLIDIAHGQPVTHWLNLDELCERVRLIQDFNQGIEELGEE